MKVLSRIFLLLILIEINSQKYSYSAELNQFGWIPWDVFNGRIIFHFSSRLHSCEPDQNCRLMDFGFVPHSCVRTYDYIFLVNEVNNQIVRYFGSASTYSLPPHPKSFDLFHVIEDFFYLNQLVNGKEQFFIYKMNSITPYGEELNIIQHQTTKWKAKPDGIYSFTQNQTQTYLTKMTLDGNDMVWNITLSLCVNSSNLLVASCYPYTYALCSPQNFIIKINNELQTISSFPADEGTIETIECSKKDLFLLYNDTSVVQYSRDFEYVYTYFIAGKMILPKDNQVRISTGYMFTALCDYSNDKNECPHSKIYQWNIIGNPIKTTLTLTKASRDISSPEIYLEEALSDINTLTFKKVELTDQKQNSYFNAFSYKKDQDTVIAYFSGAGNIEHATIGDSLITEILIPKDLSRPASLNYIKIQSPHIRPISHYASKLFQENNNTFLIIHGGLSSDYKTINSDVFSVQISDGKYQLLTQTVRIS